MIQPTNSIDDSIPTDHFQSRHMQIIENMHVHDSIINYYYGSIVSRQARTLAIGSVHGDQMLKNYSY